MAVRLPCFAAVLCNIIPSDDLSPSPGGLKESNVGNMYKKLDKTDNISIILSITFQYGEGNKIVFDEICSFYIKITSTVVRQNMNIAILLPSTPAIILAQRHYFSTIWT